MKSSSATKLTSHEALKTTEKQPDTVMGLHPCTQIDKMQAENCLSFITMGLQSTWASITHNTLNQEFSQHGSSASSRKM